MAESSPTTTDFMCSLVKAHKTGLNTSGLTKYYRNRPTLLAKDWFKHNVKTTGEKVQKLLWDVDILKPIPKRGRQ